MARASAWRKLQQQILMGHGSFNCPQCHKPHRFPEDDWTGVSNQKDRRKRQNRINQRARSESLGQNISSSLGLTLFLGQRKDARASRTAPAFRPIQLPPRSIVQGLLVSSSTEKAALITLDFSVPARCGTMKSSAAFSIHREPAFQVSEISESSLDGVPGTIEISMSTLKTNSKHYRPIRKSKT